jgi:ABC-2 type transport system ATP-binding protein
MSNEIPLTISGAELAVHTVNLHKRFGVTHALQRATITVPAGSFFLLVGPNGAGKSTLVRILLDIIRADGGTAQVLHQSTLDGAAVRARIGWVPDTTNAVYGWMTAGQFIEAHSRYFADWDNQYAARLGTTFAIDASRRLNRMSKGEVRRVQILTALAHRPRLLLLDELTDGLDPLARADVLGILAEHLADTGATVLAATHLVTEMEPFADHIGVMHRGRMLAQMPTSLIADNARNYQVRAAPHQDESDVQLPAGLRVFGSGRRGREMSWLIWGNETDVCSTLSAAGSSVLDVRPVSLEEVVVGFMSGMTGGEA